MLDEKSTKYKLLVLTKNNLNIKFDLINTCKN